ncbi:24487_t:CDS:2, partial [Racocetra persica]
AQYYKIREEAQSTNPLKEEEYSSEPNLATNLILKKHTFKKIAQAPKDMPNTQNRLKVIGKLNDQIKILNIKAKSNQREYKPKEYKLQERKPREFNLVMKEIGNPDKNRNLLLTKKKELTSPNENLKKLERLFKANQSELSDRKLYSKVRPHLANDDQIPRSEDSSEKSESEATIYTEELDSNLSSDSSSSDDSSENSNQMN